MAHHDEYPTDGGDTVSIQYARERGMWEVARWDSEDSARWYLEFRDEGNARDEFERWRPKRPLTLPDA